MHNVLTKRLKFDKMRDLFIESIDILNDLGTPYHLEGGTLLGIVRDGDLLPWDKDTDISINLEHKEKYIEAIAAIRAAGWRVTERTLSEDAPFAKAGEPRVAKVSDYWLWKMKGPHRMDIFLKYPMGDYMCWTAAGRHMRVAKSYYDGYEEIEWNGRKLRAPVNYRDYLTEKYGDWSIPVKDWSCKGEGTIFDKESGTDGDMIVDQTKKLERARKAAGV